MFESKAGGQGKQHSGDLHNLNFSIKEKEMGVMCSMDS
jgi:hypothetical protein